MKRRAFPAFSDCRGGTLWQRIFGMRHPRPKIGHRAFVDPTAQFIGCEYIEIGQRAIVGEHCWFNVNDRSGDCPRIVIRDHAFISRRGFLSSGRRIEIGSYCLIGNDSNFLGADHDFSDPFTPYMVAPALNGEEISVGTNCWMGSRCTTLKGVSIGHGCVVGAGSLVTKSIPPFSLAVGSPCRVIKRYRMREKRWVCISEWTQEDEAALPGADDYLAAIRAKHEWLPMPYVVGGNWFGNL